jgi:3',5'-cyclic-AMP phosphodiesterase
MKIGIVTDIHHGSASALSPDWSCLDQLGDAIADMASRGADLLIDLGDRISEHGTPIDVSRLTDMARIFRRFSRPRIHMLGNHDVVTLTREETASILSTPIGHRIVETETACIIAWQPDVTLEKGRPFASAGEHVSWLQDALAAVTKPVIVASHVPVSDQSMVGNYYFQNNPHQAHYPDSARIRAALGECAQPVIWVSGHQHWNSVHTIDSVHHITIQSFSERYTTAGLPAGSYAMLDLGDHAATMEIFGRDPLWFRVPMQRGGRKRWPDPIPSARAS